MGQTRSPHSPWPGTLRGAATVPGTQRWAEEQLAPGRHGAASTPRPLTVGQCVGRLGWGQAGSVPLHKPWPAGKRQTLPVDTG